MGQACHTHVRRQLQDRLALADSWISRGDLVAGMDWTAARLDDELADLVMAGKALFNARTRQYRATGSALARKAVQQLMRASADTVRVGLAMPDPKNKALMQLALAMRSTGPDGEPLISSVELELPCAGLAEKMRLMALVQQHGLASSTTTTTTTTTTEGEAHGREHAGV